MFVTFYSVIGLCVLLGLGIVALDHLPRRTASALPIEPVPAPVDQDHQETRQMGETSAVTHFGAPGSASSVVVTAYLTGLLD